MEDFKMEKYGLGDIVLGIPPEIGQRILPSTGAETPGGA